MITQQGYETILKRLVTEETNKLIDKHSAQIRHEISGDEPHVRLVELVEFVIRKFAKLQAENDILRIMQGLKIKAHRTCAALAAHTSEDSQVLAASTKPATLRTHMVAEVIFDNWGNDEDPMSNWSLLRKHASFVHRAGCEFMLNVQITGLAALLREQGFSTDLIDLAEAARNKGCDYLMLYH